MRTRRGRRAFLAHSAMGGGRERSRCRGVAPSLKGQLESVQSSQESATWRGPRWSTAVSELPSGGQGGLFLPGAATV